MKRILAAFAILLCSLTFARAFTLAPGRESQSLGGQWNYIVDPMNTGIYKYQMQLQKPSKRYFADRHFYEDKTKLIEYDFDHAPTLTVPGDWNTQSDKLYYYEGSIWYRRTVDFKPVDGRRWFLYFGAVNYQCMVGVNNNILGTHKGGFTPFWFEVTDVLQEGENSLVVWVNNTRGESEVPTVNFDWWNYGGITRDVFLVSVPKVFISDYRICFDGKQIDIKVKLDGGNCPVTVEIPELGIKKKACTGRDSEVSFKVKANPERWCPENPKLYDIVVSTADDSIRDRVGFRTIRVDGEQILLNDKPVFLKGVAVHDETIGLNPGRCRNEGDARALLEAAKDLGCTFLRLAHYPHSEEMVRLAEEMGFMLWEEIPCYWNIDWSSEETYANAENQLVEMIGRDANRAATIIWSVANETPRTPERLAFLGKLIAKARALDPTRLISAALQKDKPDFYHPIIEDELVDLTDIISFNQYIGWYDGKPADCDKITWTVPRGKPVLISEFGGGALYGNHGSDSELFTEEYLELLYRKNLEMLGRIPALNGLCPWCLKDFRSPKRPLNGIQDDFNRKGLIDEQGRRKQAFFVMKDYYSSLSGLTVGTFNVRFLDDYRPDYDYKFGGQPWMVRRPAVKAFFEQNDIDIVGLQEVRRTQARDLEEDFGKDWFVYCPGRLSGAEMVRTSDEAVGLMFRKSRFNLLGHGRFWLSDSTDVAGSKRLGQSSPIVTSWVHLEEKYRPGKQLWFFSAHISWSVSENPALPDQEVETLLTEMERLTGIGRDEFKSSETPVFLVGDLNNTVEESPIQTLESIFNDARTASPASASTNIKTFNCYGKESKASIIDYIFFGAGSAKEYIVDTSSYDPDVKFISDHYPVLSRINYE